MKNKKLFLVIFLFSILSALNVNATGTVNGQWEFYAIYNVTQYKDYINDNVSNTVNITIVS